jgi:DNA invertase Pin-like site-specific DNA recombinase
MDEENNTIKYFAYVRKSTEGDERQALSIESQKEKIEEIFPDLEITEFLEEKHSAFKPNSRPVFKGMMERIQAGEAEGIIAWHPDRLSRNEIDASAVTYSIRNGIIQDLKFGSYNFDNSPEGIMMLQLALSQSQYFSSKLGKDVKRGLEKKVSDGWLPGRAPEGYLNDMRLEKGRRTITPDKKRLPLVRKAFDLVLSGNRNASEALHILNNDWGYRTRRGKPLSRSAWYKMLANPFYAGIIVYNGKESKGKHKPLITMDEFNRIQDILGNRGAKRRPKSKDFTFSGMFTCGECGCSVTAEHKAKFLKSKNRVQGYDYYHCTRKKKGVNCRQGSVREEEITGEAVKIMEKLEMHPKFLEWALDYLEEEKKKEYKGGKIARENKEKEKEDVKKQISELTSMRVKRLLGDEEYLEEKGKLKSELESLNNRNNTSEENRKDTAELTKETFLFCYYAKDNFLKADKQGKREILSKLGSNRQIKDKKVLISVHKWLLPIYENVDNLNAEMERLEPKYFALHYKKSEALTSLRLSWLRVWDKVGTKIYNI